MIGSCLRSSTRRAALVLPALALALLCSACERPDHIEIDPRMPRLVHKGESVRLHAKMMDRRGTIYPTERASWTSRDPFIASVDANGEVAALTSGHTIITAHWQELSAEVPLEVDLVESLKADPDTISIKVDADPTKIQVQAIGIDGRPRPDREVRLTSSDPSTVRIDGGGSAWGIKPGDAIVHAKCDDKQTDVHVTVTKK